MPEDKLEELRRKASTGEIDTVLVCLVDMQGRLMGKRFHVQNFLDHAHAETHCCNYLLATDLEMATPEGFRATSWESGYGDYTMRPDASTIRPLPWLEGTAMVLCDLEDHEAHAPVAHAPRQMLKGQIARLAERGLAPMMATELEFFLFEGTARENREAGFRNLRPHVEHNQDYAIQLGTRDEVVMRPLRNMLYAAGIEVECSKGEAETGQEELNLRYQDALSCADYHTIAKHAAKDIAAAHGLTASFLPKWHTDKVGSASHVHCSLFRDGANAFHDPARPMGKSVLMDHFVAGLLKYAPDYTVFLAPYVNSYKRFRKGTFAPTKAVWSVDNRTAGFRMCGAGTKGVRIECRIGGSDMNPYLAQAAMLAAGLAGIEEELALPDPISGDIYANDGAANVPTTLREATETLRGSAMLRAAFGDGVVDHYARAAEVEQEAFDAAVTDWEISRGFERC
ncbi:glutamine synthetase family protein [Salipiger abyssi]|uniref:glutamine synthetase family protein n=1 Tax=Salipiger abyssi TaxID=1250539 RepID=UPI001A8EF0E3|nr:glutamine synthetase family protein [Salipiger abyssi]MBN9889961.1 glutamine synthetase [Salipiger abyssi]